LIEQQFSDMDQLGAHRQLPEGRELTADEIQRNRERRGERMNAMVAATEAGRVKPQPDTSDVNRTFRPLD
jgi:hypothetical protein